MRSIVSIVISIALASACFAQPGEKPGGLTPEEVVSLMENRIGSPSIVPGQIVVKLKPSVQPSSFVVPMGASDSFQTTSGGELVITLSGAGFGAMSAGDQVERTMELVDDLRDRAEVEYAQANYFLQIVNQPIDPLYGQQWHYFENGLGEGQAGGGIGLPSAWRTAVGSGTVVVAVIDTGILGEHPDIQGSPNLLNGFDMISDPTVAADGDGRDADATDPGDGVAQGECGVDFFGNPRPSRDIPDSWHGSHVAGTVGVGFTNNEVGIAGVNWNVRILPVRVLGKCGGSTVDINDAIRWAAGLTVPGVVDNPNKADVINLSLGGFGSCSDAPATQRAIDDAVATGVTVIAAAGNEGRDASGFMPASCENVITVAAADRRGHLASRYSNFGQTVDILAPGGDVERDDDDDGNPDGVLSYVQGGYSFYNGTSMAAPHVAGVAALLKGQQSQLTPAEIEAELKGRTLSRTQAQCPKPCGAGLLDASFLSEGGAGGGGTDVTPPENEEEKKDVPATSLWWILVGSIVVLWFASRRTARSGE